MISLIKNILKMTKKSQTIKESSRQENLNKLRDSAEFYKENGYWDE
jgi:hypothetical protein